MNITWSSTKLLEVCIFYHDKNDTFLFVYREFFFIFPYEDNRVNTLLNAIKKIIEHVNTVASTVKSVSIFLFLTMYPAIIGNDILAMEPEAENQPCKTPCGLRPTTKREMILFVKLTSYIMILNCTRL